MCPLKAEDGSDEYGGAKPFSEPETRIVRLLAETSRPQVSSSMSKLNVLLNALRGVTPPTGYLSIEIAVVAISRLVI